MIFFGVFFLFVFVCLFFFVWGVGWGGTMNDGIEWYFILIMLVLVEIVVITFITCDLFIYY